MLGANSETWVRLHFRAGSNPPLSFRYGKVASTEFLPQWEFHGERQDVDQNRSRWTFTYVDPRTRLQVTVKCIFLKDFGTMEWVAFFKNLGPKDSPLIEDIQIVDCAFERQAPKEFILHRALGSDAKRNDFAPIEDTLGPNVIVKLTPVGGRSSNTNVFPFFNLEAKGEGGMMIAIGWSGQWTASFQRETPTSVRFRAGMELTRFKLHPGEQIRTPRMLFMPWTGADRIAGHNRFRQLLLQHFVPHLDGKPVTLPFACSGCRGQKLGDEANKFTEANQLEFFPKFVPYGVEYHWIDAGWFEGRWPNGVGNWIIRHDGFPNGLRPISDAAKQLGMGFVLWFEPERVRSGTWIDKHHPDWILKFKGKTMLLNLGNPDALRWLTEHIGGMIESEGIAVFRLDFNMDPLAYWRKADKKDRQGITEIRYIEGFYAFWDALRERFPRLIIDNCASGGRRIDLETISRSVALWRTDYQYFEPMGYQSHTYALSFWLPTTSTGNKVPDAYTFRSAMNNGLVLGWDPFSPDFSEEDAKKRAAEFHRARLFFFGDFFPLTSYSTEDNAWIAYQFHRPDLRQGLVLAFRRVNAPQETIKVALRGLDPASEYTFEDADSQQVTTRGGTAVMNSLELTAKTAPAAILLFYGQK